MPNKSISRCVNSPARIIIVDDHPIVREGLAALLAGIPDFVVIGQAENTVDAMSLFEHNPPDAWIVDISLKHENGLDLIRRVKDRDPQARILVVSMHDENLYGERALKAGAMGYLNKQAASRNIVSAIRQILSGRHYLSEELSDRLLSRNLNGASPVAESGIAALTDRELEVFRLIGLGVTTAEIAEKLHLSIKTVETHRQKIKGKLNLKNAAELSREAAQWSLLNN